MQCFERLKHHKNNNRFFCFNFGYLHSSLGLFESSLGFSFVIQFAFKKKRRTFLHAHLVLDGRELVKVNGGVMGANGI